MTTRPLERLRALLAPEGAALDLGALRVSVVAVLLASGSVASAEHWAALPEAARTVPLGVGWLVPHLPIDPPTVQLAHLALRLVGGLALVGLFTRAALALLVPLAFYLLLVPQLGGAVFHDHHLLWLLGILAASPCGDALSLDAWWARRRGRPTPARGHAHGAAVRAAWLVIGCVFFFPGVHKLAESGLDWALSDNLRNQLWWKWAQDPALLPALRIDRIPWLCRLLALLTIVFELTFLPLVLYPRTRALAVLGALAFHAGAELFMGIQFSVLWASYGMFVPWEALARRVGLVEAEGGAEPVRALVPVAAAAALVLAGIVGAGALGAMQAYPFACYPTFEWSAPDHMPAMVVELEGADGARTALDRALFQEPGPRGWALGWRLVGVYGATSPAAIEAWWRDASSRAPLASAVQAGDVVHVLRAEITVDPDCPVEVLSAREVWSGPAR